MNFSHPFSRYGAALVMVKENLEDMSAITSSMLSKYIEDGLNHFRMKTDNNPDTDDILDFEFIDMQTILNRNIERISSKGVFLCPNFITNDLKASNAWNATFGIWNTLKNGSNVLRIGAKITMGINPIAGELNNGKKTKSNSSGTLLEAACSAITNTTIIKPYLAYRKDGGTYVPTAIIPDLELDEMKSFIQFYVLMINSTINQNQLMKKKVFRKNGETPSFSKLRPPIYNGNFPYAPNSSSFGVVSLLGSIGRWAKEANKIVDGQKVLESLKDRPIYLIQYGHAQSITFSHHIIDLAKDHKLSEIVFAIQRSVIFLSDDKNKKAKDSKSQLFNLLSSRFLQLFNKPAFNDFFSIRAEYSFPLLELFNYFFMKQMNIKKEVIDSVRLLGLWLNYVAYKVGDREITPIKENQKDSVTHKKERDEKVNKIQQNILIELESSVFGARRPSEILNVIVRAGRLSGMSAPSESDVFQGAVLSGEVEMNDAKSMLMAYARTKNRYIKTSSRKLEDVDIEPEEDINNEITVTD